MELSEFSLKMLESGYLQKGETPDQLFKRVALAGCKDSPERAERVEGYFKKLWFMGATPVLTNMGTDRGLPISCNVIKVGDSKKDIFSAFNEFNYLASYGAGVGMDWSGVRAKGEPIAKIGASAGIVPFLKMNDAGTSAISQGALRRGSMAAYLNIHHPEIKEFIEIRKPTGGDSRRKCLDIHNAVVLTDEFMEAVMNQTAYNLYSITTGEVVEQLDAFETFSKILDTRMETGEPYIMFYDNVNKAVPECYKLAGYTVYNSNLCSEIMLHTSPEKTAVCCLSSVNLLKFDEWKDDELFIEDCLYFLDGVLQEFLDKVKQLPEECQNAFQHSVDSILEERAVGLGVMNWHGLLQSKGIPFESTIAISLTHKVFGHIKAKADAANTEIGKERGSCYLVERLGLPPQRFSHTMAIAPTASIALITNNASQGIEPSLSNLFVIKNKVGMTEVKNVHLEKVIKDYAHANKRSGKWVSEQWEQIRADKGSVANLNWMDTYVKDVFKTAFEIDQHWIIEQAAARQPHIDQGQSLNVFLAAEVSKQYLFDLHVSAWKKDVKALYYCRSNSVGATSVSKTVERDVIPERPKYDECLACQ